MKQLGMGALLAGALLGCTAAQAGVSVSAVNTATYVEDHGDAFDLAQGATVTGSSNCCIFGSGYAGNAIGFSYQAFNGEVGAIPYDGSIQASISFRTAAPVQLYGFDLYLSEDGQSNASIRDFLAVALYGSADGVHYDPLGGASFDGSSYWQQFGGTTVRVRSLFAPQTYQYFRLDTLSPADYSGRITELDAITAAVPEPASWALLLAGGAVALTAARRRQTGR